MKYIFKDYVYTAEVYRDHFSEYKGHSFKISGILEEDVSGQHVFIECIDDPSIKVIGCVHLFDLEEINENI